MTFLHQLDETDCGAACLAIVARHHRSRHSLTTIREIAGTARQGTNLAGLVKAGQALGFQAKALKGDAGALTPDLEGPFIAHLALPQPGTDQVLFHFVVVARVTKTKVLVLDPGEGRRWWSRSEFLAKWTGYVVFLTPTPEFRPVKETKGLFARFLPLLIPHRSTLVKVAVASVLLIVLGIASSLYFRYLIDEVLFSRAELTLHVLSLGVVLLTLFQVLLGAVRGHLLLHFSLKVDFRLIFSYFRHVLRLPVGFFDSRKTGEILSRLEDAQHIRDALSQASVSVVMDTLMVAVVGVVLYFQSPLLFWIAVATVPLSSLVVWLFSGPFSRRYRQLMAQSSDVQSYLVEAVAGNATVKALNAADLVFHEYEKRQMKAVWTGYRLGVLQNVQGALVGLIDGWGGNVLFWVGSVFILQGQVSLGQLVSFSALLGYFLGPLKSLLNLQPSLQQAFVAADRLGEILDLDPEIPEEGRWLKPDRFAGGLEVRDVAFRYGTRKLVLDGLDFRVDPGDWVAFVGASGGGKTTLVKLLLKFYRPERGEIRLDGHNLEDLDTVHLRTRIGYVPQEIFLFSGTIAENIALHRPDAPLEDIVAAAQKARAHEFIVDLPQRYNTVLAERGASLSGGERQRLALARALLGKPDLLVFDEATSNLDSLTEHEIHQTLETLRGDRVTTVLIAHRLRTVTRCDRIFVMDKGRIVEQGGHAELLAWKGVYAQLWEGATR